MSLITRASRRLVREYNERHRFPRMVAGKQKIFCIGCNKTGTTSFKRALTDLGVIVGSEGKALHLLPYYREGEFEKIIEFCHSAQAFQDTPFSYPQTYKYLYQAFPDAKFILTVRESADQWYQSLTRFHAKLLGLDHIPTKYDLQNSSYGWKGRMWESNRILYGSPEDDPYNKSALIRYYEGHNQAVSEYFSDKPGSLLILNIAEPGSFQKFIDFIGYESSRTQFPWENRT